MTSTAASGRPLRIALVLGSGGARGYAHIGVIEELERRGHEVVAVAGSSIGALVGGLHAAGGLDEFTTLVKGLSRTTVLKYLDLSLRGPGMLEGDRIMRMLHGIVGDVRIEDLGTPVTIVATDILQQREVWFTQGALLAAIRASIAIPTAFTPVSIGGRVLADGAVLNPLPIDAALAHPADAIIGVSLSGRNPGLGMAAPTHDTAEEGGVEVPWTDRIAESFLATGLGRRIAALAGGPGGSGGSQGERAPVTPELETVSEQAAAGAGPAAAETPAEQKAERSAARTAASRSAARRATEKQRLFDPLPTTLTSRDMTTFALDTMQQAIEVSRTAATPPDVHISVPIPTASTFDFHRATEMIELGRDLAVEAFDKVGI